MPNDSTVAKRIGQLLRHHRIDVLGLTLPDVERMVSARFKPGVRFQQIHKLEQGDVERPSLRDIVMLAEVYGIPLTDIVRSSGLAYPNVEPPKESETKRVFRTLVEALMTTATDDQLNSLIPLMQAVANHFRQPRLATVPNEA
jgi:transcriptional regulator with XRE-family HTH domain